MAAYKNGISDAKIGNIVVDFAEVDYMDSAALGMLLVLRDHAQEANISLSIARLSSFAVRMFEIASFDRMFTIN